MHLPYLSHQCSKASPVLSDNPRSLFSPRKEAAVYTSRLPDIYRRAPEVRCRGPDAGKMSLHCHPDDVPVRSWFLPILPLPAQIFPFVQSFPPLLLTSCIPLPFSEYPPKHSCMGFLFSHTVSLQILHQLLPLPHGSRDSRVPQGSQIRSFFAALPVSEKGIQNLPLQKDQRQLYLLFQASSTA